MSQKNVTPTPSLWLLVKYVNISQTRLSVAKKRKPLRLAQGFKKYIATNKSEIDFLTLGPLTLFIYISPGLKNTFRELEHTQVSICGRVSHSGG